jgi:hypothetical protein
MVSIVDYDQASRREILKALSAAGVSGVSLGMLSDDVLAETHADEIPYVRAVRVKTRRRRTNARGDSPEEESPSARRVVRMGQSSSAARRREEAASEGRGTLRDERTRGRRGLKWTRAGHSQHVRDPRR